METKIHNLSEFLNLLNDYKAQFSKTYRTGGFMFRGMSDISWSLLPGIFRKYPEKQNSKKITSASYSGNIFSINEYEILSHFRKEASGLLTHISPKDDFTWLQYAQHYGVPTRLLDFTANPLVAMYFCCQSESETDGVVWIINTVIFERWTTSELPCNDRHIAYTREAVINSIMREMRGELDRGEVNSEPHEKKNLPIMFIPPYIDQRMSAQSSRFLLWGNNQSALENMIKADNEMQLCPGVRFDVQGDQRFWAKTIIPAGCKHSIMRELDLLNINEKSIFPGLDGIGKYINKYYQNNVDDMLELL